MILESKILSRERKILEYIGLYEIIGGSIGIGLILYGTIKLNVFSFLGIMILMFIAAFYSFSIYAGFKLLKYQEKNILYSQIVQFLQIPSFALLGLMFTLTAGFSFFVGFDYTNDFIFKFFFDIPGVATKFYINSDNSIIYVYVNLIPIIILYLLEKSLSKIKNVKEKIDLINE